MMYRFHWNDKKYAIYAFDVYSYDKKIIAKALFINDITEIERHNTQKLINNSAYLFVLLFLIILIIEWGFRTLIQKLDDANEQLHKNQAFLRSILDASHDGVVMLDREARCLFCNRAYLQMTGSTNEKMVQLGCVGLNIHEDPPMALSVLEQVREKGCIENIEKSCVVKDGKKLHVNISITLMPDKESFW